MATSRLTQHRVDSLKPGRKVRDVRDRVPKCFGIRILPSGRKRNVLHSQVVGRRIWHASGDTEIASLAHARSKARTMPASRLHGDDARPVAPVLFETAAGDVLRCCGRHWNPRTLEVNLGYCKNMDARSWLAMSPTM